MTFLTGPEEVQFYEPVISFSVFSASSSSSPTFPVNPNPYSHPWESVVPQSYGNVWDDSLSYQDQDQSGLWS